jgi:hypothetical protein
LHIPAFPLLLATSAAHLITYAFLVWRFDLLTDREQRVIAA